MILIVEEILLYFSLKYAGDYEKIYRALERKENIDKQEKDRLLATLHSKYTTIVSADYPERLKYIDCPPFVLYYYGDLTYVTSKTIGVIGMRIPSLYGTTITKKIVSHLVDHQYTIVSGMARGIDTIAHVQAIEKQGKTIAVLGSGIDYCYPRKNEKIYHILKTEQFICSEYPEYTKPTPTSFPKRNRIIAGLSQALLVTEAMLKSGTMITIGYALEQGKDIFCMPGRITDYQGCNYLIQQGAKLVSTIDDILEG